MQIYRVSDTHYNILHSSWKINTVLFWFVFLWFCLKSMGEFNDLLAPIPDGFITGTVTSGIRHNKHNQAWTLCDSTRMFAIRENSLKRSKSNIRSTEMSLVDNRWLIYALVVLCLKQFLHKFMLIYDWIKEPRSWKKSYWYIHASPVFCLKRIKNNELHISKLITFNIWPQIKFSVKLLLGRRERNHSTLSLGEKHDNI